MTERWFYAKDKKKHGPVSREDLQALLARGELTPADMVLQEGTARWAPAGSVPPPPAAKPQPAAIAAGAPPAAPEPLVLTLVADDSPPAAPAAAIVAEPISAVPAPRRGLAGRCAQGTVQALAQVPRSVHAAVSQTGRLVGYWGSKRQTARLGHHARRALFALGLGLYQKGLGDPALSRQVADLEARLHVIQEARGSSREALRERDALLVRMAAPWAQSPNAPPGLEQEHARAFHAERVRAHQEDAHARARADLYPAHAAGRARIWAGVGLFAALIGLGVFLLTASDGPAPALIRQGPVAAKGTPPEPRDPGKPETPAKKTLKQLFAQLAPAVPMVDCIGAGRGSGFLVRHGDRYLVVTNRHVAEHGRAGLVVNFLRSGKGGREERLIVPAIKTKLVAVHRVVDLALIDVTPAADEVKQWGIKPVTLAPKQHTPEQGEHVFAIGHPGDAAGGVLTRTLSDGIISAVKRNDRFARGDFTQVTVPINPGNSGGPIFDDEGRVIAVATFMIRQSNDRGLTLEALNFGLDSYYIHEILEDPGKSLSEQEIVALLNRNGRPSQPSDTLRAEMDAKTKALLAKGYKAFTDDLKTSQVPFRINSHGLYSFTAKRLQPRDQVYVFVVSRGAKDVNLHVYNQAGKLVKQDVSGRPDPELEFEAPIGGDFSLVLSNMTANPVEGAMVLLLRLDRKTP